jgi:hypothetical protein
MIRDILQTFGPKRLEEIESALKSTALRVRRSIQPARRSTVVCPKCLWHCAVPSTRRTGLDLLLAVFFLHPFRCRSCHKRHHRLSL